MTFLKPQASQGIGACTPHSLCEIRKVFSPKHISLHGSWIYAARARRGTQDRQRGGGKQADAPLPLLVRKRFDTRALEFSG